jgi:FtsZ-binding cell division protein ZapB
MAQKQASEVIRVLLQEIERLKAGGDVATDDAELRGQIRALRQENRDLRQENDDLKKTVRPVGSAVEAQEREGDVAVTCVTVGDEAERVSEVVAPASAGEPLAAAAQPPPPNANPYAIEINETLDAVQVQLETEIAEANAWTVAAEDQCTRVSVRARAGSKWNVVRVEMRAPMPCGVGFVLNRFLLNAENQMK